MMPTSGSVSGLRHPPLDLAVEVTVCPPLVLLAAWTTIHVLGAIPRHITLTSR
jgi:hypothetical protein